MNTNTATSLETIDRDDLSTAVGGDGGWLDKAASWVGAAVGSGLGAVAGVGGLVTGPGAPVAEAAAVGAGGAIGYDAGPAILHGAGSLIGKAAGYVKGAYDNAANSVKSIARRG